MKRFRYALNAALDEALGAERSAAQAFVACRHAAGAAAERAAAHNVGIEAAVARAAARERLLGCGGSRSRATHDFIDCERHLAALTSRGVGAQRAAAHAACERDAAHVEFVARTQRRRAFAAHRERALAAHRAACELADSAAFDESNASGREARWLVAGTSPA